VSHTGYPLTVVALHGFVDSLRLELQLEQEKKGLPAVALTITSTIIGNIDTDR